MKKTSRKVVDFFYWLFVLASVFPFAMTASCMGGVLGAISGEETSRFALIIGPLVGSFGGAFIGALMLSLIFSPRDVKWLAVTFGALGGIVAGISAFRDLVFVLATRSGEEFILGENILIGVPGWAVGLGWGPFFGGLGGMLGAIVVGQLAQPRTTKSARDETPKDETPKDVRMKA